MIKLSEQFQQKKYDCNECRKYKRYESVNCTGEKIPKPIIRDEDVRFVIDKTSYLNFCPAILMYDSNVIDLLELYSLYKDGFLQDEGSISNQDYFYISSMLELKSIENKAMSEESGEIPNA